MDTKKDKLIKINQKNILNAAKVLFSNKGYVHTTMDEIAKTANYSKSTVYVYFKSKEEIYFSIVYDSMKQLQKLLRKNLDASIDFESNYYKACNTLVKYQEMNPQYFDSIQGELHIKEDDFKTLPILQEIYLIGKDINQQLTEIIQSGIESNYLRSDLLILPMAFTLWGSICGIITLTSKKFAFINDSTGMNKEQFLHLGFTLLLNSIKKN